MLLPRSQGSEAIFDKIPLSKNPGRILSDSFPAGFRVWWKKYKPFWGNHHDVIIPATDNHAVWVLGAQPDEDVVRKTYEETGRKPLHIINMLHEDERVIDTQDEKKLQSEHIVSAVDRNPLFDHGTVSVTTGRNQTVSAMVQFQQKFYVEFNTVPPTTTFYCHCMAGKSRSFLETVSFLYFYPDKKKLFDFEKWPPEMVEKIDRQSPGLRDRLRNNPSLSDMAEFVKIQRPDVKNVWKMDGDQAGFLGLMTLAKLKRDLTSLATRDEREPHREDILDLAIRDEGRLYKDAQDIRLILSAPLDRGFRDPEDRRQQEESLVMVYEAYQKRGVNLLMAMVVPIRDNVNPATYSDLKSFETQFAKRSPSEQARFAILLKNLEERDPFLDLGPLRGKSSEYAEMAAKNVTKLATGDHIELFRSFDFGSDYCKDITQKILVGNRYDQYNGADQLVELFAISKIRGQPPGKAQELFREAILDGLLKCADAQFATLKGFLDKLIAKPAGRDFAVDVVDEHFKEITSIIERNELSYSRQFELVQKLVDLGHQQAYELAAKLQVSYCASGLFTKVFRGSLSLVQIAGLRQLAKRKKEVVFY